MGSAGPLPVPDRLGGRGAEAAAAGGGAHQERLQPSRLGQRRLLHGAVGAGRPEGAASTTRPRRRTWKRWPTTPAASGPPWVCR